MRGLLITTLLAAGLAAWSPVAHADAIDMPPDDCPTGAVGVSSHDGAYCQPSTCDPKTACRDEGTLCQPDVGLCVEEQTVACGGKRSDMDKPCSVTLRVAHGPCSRDSDCGEGTCEFAPRCVRPTLNEKLPWLIGLGGGAALLAFAVLLAFRRQRERDPDAEASDADA